ncbi:heavy-metal-associated domain-containing protein [Nafulsella turpanensis]|uniref:heavy-metal-associated domain-containing protein n=1 Tax=Nafulsella turpanensis TaxID=1265690 RepID=UPI000590380B|nr:heavy-metal-associated domain-containing protein [Nafulsella turpanensis]
MGRNNSIKAKRAQWYSRLPFFCVFFIFVMAFSCSSPGEDKQEKSEQKLPAQNLTKTTIPIEGMSCNACVASIKKELKSLDALEGVEVSLQHRNATVFYEEGTITPQQIQDAIKRIGYKAGEPVTEKNR